MKLALALLGLGTLAQATTISGVNTFDLTATMDRESSGLHVVADGAFTFNWPANGNVIGLNDLTAFSLTVTEQAAYNWGIQEPIQTTTVGLDSVESFTFDAGSDTLIAQVQVKPDDPNGVFSIGPNPATFLFGNFPILASLDQAFGPGDPSPASDPVAAATAPEPAGLALFGLAGIGLGVLRKRRVQ